MHKISPSLILVMKFILISNYVAKRLCGFMNFNQGTGNYFHQHVASVTSTKVFSSPMCCVLTTSKG